MNTQALWFISRATGIASVLLFTAILVLGMVLSRLRRPTSQVPTVLMGMHRWLSLGG